MINNPEVFNQVAFSLAKHYVCVYYVDLDTNRYFVFNDTINAGASGFPSEGEDFFADCLKNADRFVHPDDIQMLAESCSKEKIIEGFSDRGVFSVSFRSIAEGSVRHMRHIFVLCNDKKHIVCCLDDIEKEFKEKEKQKKNLKSAEIMARRDELTGVKNNHAFKEYVDALDEMISSDSEGTEFSVVMCDINDLKIINDTRGHSYGDEAIQAACRLICETFQHSPVFRVGGDEFVSVLTGQDYENRDYLIRTIREESESNRKSRSGPVIAVGIASFGAEDKTFSNVLERADQLMYIDKNTIKSQKTVEGLKNLDMIDTPIPPERKRLLDAFFGALVTVTGGGYVYLSDMRYDFSRWSLSLVDDFGFESEYMYHADKIFREVVHPEDIEVLDYGTKSVLSGKAEVQPIHYRARKKDGTYIVLHTRGFVLTDSNGNPDYFGGIIVCD
ncbi:diguanylate cyclase (GGDEF) domain-containing protein [Lachnospiraceae bacterium]|nr:diguanylate cyclase (GGDEF) domain-containing protein [Lachnospiraceae bacterium]